MKKILFLLTLLMTMLYGRAATEVTFDFTANEWNHPLGTALEGDPGNLDDLTKDDVLVVFKQAKHKDYPPRYWSGPQIRAYTNNIIRVVAPTGKAITKIEFTAAGTSYFGLTTAGGTLEGTTWTGNAAYAKFTPTKTNRLTKMVVTLDEADEATDKTGDAEEKVFLDFNDPTIHKEFDVVSTTYLTEDIVLSDGHRDSDDKIDGENRVTTTIPYIPDVANTRQNYLRYFGSKVSMYLRGGKVVFKTHADKIIKNIKMTASAFNATLNGEEVTKEQITGDGWEGNSNIVEMEVTEGTNISNITFVIADKPMEEVVEPELTEFYIMGSGTENEWDNTTAMTLNEETDAFEYELTLTSTGYITFGDVAFTDWDDFNANHRYGIGEGDVNATLDTPTKLEKYNGCLVITEAGKYKVTVTKDLEVTITKTGDITAEISKVQICGATDPEWNNRIDFELTKGESEEEVYTGVLNLTESTDDVEFKLVVNEGNWIGFNQLTLDAPEGWVEGPNGDGNNFLLKNADTSYQTYTITATWEANADAVSNWTLKIEGKDKRVVDVTVGDEEIAAAGNDIAAAVAAATGNAVAGNITVNLAEDGEYTISKSLTAGGNVVINGNGATIDASGLTQPFIAFSKEPSIAPVASGQYVIEDPIMVDNVIINGLTKALFADNGKSYAYVNLSVKNSLFHYTTQGNVVFNFASSMAINFNILGCTFYSDAPGTGNFIAMSGKRPWQITGFESETGKFTCANNTFYNVAKSKQFMNTNTLKGQKYLYEFNSNIFVDVSNKKIYGNMTNNKKQLTTDGLNTYMFDGAFFNETNYNGDEGLQTDPGFADAAGGDFTLDFASEQWAQKTGDPRWIADDPTVMVAPESGDFAAIVAQAVKEGKETLALPAGAAYKAGSTVYVDKKLNIIGDESDPATLELGMKGFVIKDALDMENMIIDAATNAEPFIALSAEPNEELLGANNGSDYYNIMDPVILRNLTITGVKGKLIYDNNKKYALDNLLIENCIVQLRTPKDKKETVIYMQGGGIRMLEVNTSTFYQKGQGDNDYFVRYNNSARLDRMGYNKDMEAEDFVPEGFIYESNTFYKVAYEGQWGNYSGFNGQKYTAFTVNKNIWVDCGSGQIARRMLGSRGAEFYEVCEFDQNTYIYNGTAETEGTMKNGEPVGTYDLSGTAITKVPTFKQVATGDFTLDANDVQ
ncbi:MAG: DUF4957 domain-containing protein, partial [Prevotella sp.]|nr:DUF4957 domain-containing protein [Prevotella sp.]